jgi:uncharacterized coiled-coil protein SlyX
MKKTILFENYMHRSLGRCAFFSLLITCFAFPPMANAVVPPPDGGYPGFNTAEGQNALFGLTTGVANTGVGWYSLFSNTDGSYNTAVGAGTLLFNIGDQTAFEGVDNTAVGAAALLFNTTGTDNTATGAAALLNNTGGSNNTATGSFALQSNTTGNLNTATGLSALYSNTTGIGNTAVGSALTLNTTGQGNTAIGTGALSSNTTGNGNIALGNFAGHDLTTGDQNIVIGNANAVAGESNTMRFGSSLLQTRAFISGIRGVATGNNDAVAVLIDSDGQLGTVSSSRRFKKEIKAMEQASEAILSLNPVTFRYKSDNTNRPEFGLIAEEVAQVNPDLVVRDKNGEIYTVRYEAVNAMLLNEFLKEHHRVKDLETTIASLKSTDAEQEATIANQQEQIEALTAGLQKVSAEIELSKFATGRISRGGPALQPIVNNP